MPSFASIADDLGTGDLILFDGPFLDSREIELIESVLEKSHQGFASHVAMIVRLPDCPEPLLWESSLVRTLNDHLTGKPAPGVHLLTARELIQHCGDQEYTFACRHLNPRPTDTQEAALARYLTRTDGKRFPSLAAMALHVLAGRALGLPDWTGTFFCAELVAATYIALGLLPAKPVPNRYFPSDFCSANSDKLPLQGGFALSPDQVFTAS